MRSAWTILTRVALLGAVCAAGIGCPNATTPPNYTPAIVVSPKTLDFGTDATTMTFTASKTWTSQPMSAFTVVASKSWMQVSPATGSSDGPTDPVTITVVVDRSLMTAGPNTGTVTVSAPGVVQQIVTVTAQARLVANFSVQPTLAYVGDPITFLDLSEVAVGEPAISSWLWDFGDGKSTSTEQNPIYGYDTEGQYTIKLTVGNGLISAARERVNLIQINVKATPDAEFTVSDQAPQAYTAVQFTDLSNPGTAPITSWLWDFGDGTAASTSPSPSHIYTGAASYDVSLTVTTVHGSDTEVKLGYVTPTPVGPVADFSSDTVTPVFGTPVQFYDESFVGTSPITSWLWDFGDGKGTSTQQNPTHTYSGQGQFTVSLTVTTAVGSDTATETDYISVQVAGPTADFTISDSSPDINTAVTFTDTSDPGSAPGGITSWLWNFGDGTTFNGQAPPPHIYDGSAKYVILKTYDVSLAVQTDHGSDSETKLISLQVEPPDAAFEADQTEVPPDTAVTFTDLSDPGTVPGGITSWLWNFGDDSASASSTEQNPVHTYAGHETATKHYTVTLQVFTDHAGIDSTESKSAYITVWPRTPSAAFSADMTRVVTDLDEIQFTDESPAGPDYITDWEWNFGDGSPVSTAQNPTHTYDTAGTYTVSLKVTNKISEEATETKTGYITVFDDTLLDKYLRTDDGEYTYTVASTVTTADYTAKVIELTSQEWRPADVSVPVNGLWKHWLTIITPTTKSLSDTALLVISGGGNTATPPTVDPTLAALVPLLGAPVVLLEQVPNQAMEFVSDANPFPDGKRSEDEIVAYTFDRYMVNYPNASGETWPSYLPMVKSAVKAMDTVQAEFPAIEKFVVTGASKRGWTTWLTGATDNRVVGIMPMVINILNMGDQMDHHFMAYGEYSEEIRDYDSTAVYTYGNDVISRIPTAAGQALLDIVDPYRYLERYATIPKLEICGTGDEFFLPDSAQWYFDNLPGTKRLRYTPNVGHSLGGDYWATVAAAVPFFYGVAEDEDIPSFTWALTSTGATSWRLTVTADPAKLPDVVKAWTATTESGYRDFRNGGNASGVTPTWTSQDVSGSGGVYAFDLDEPVGTRWTGVFMELTYPSDFTIPLIDDNYTFTTEVFVVPETMPYADPHP
jgi:PKD repeat protein